jgi:predicted Zn-dependent protease
MVTSNTAMALLELGRTAEASNLIDEYLKGHPTEQSSETLSVQAMILAKLGNPQDAENAIQRALAIGRGMQHFHHTTYNVASAYAMMNKPDDAMKWLQFTADDGFPCYPLFAQDAQLNTLRKDDRFIAFMAQLKQQWERYKANYWLP